MHADDYAGFNELYLGGEIREVACMVHIRRKFVDTFRAEGSVIAEETIKRIAKLYAVEKEARGQPPVNQVQLRQEKARPVLEALEIWPAEQPRRVSG